MSGVTHLTVPEDAQGIRLDRWFRRQYPNVPHGRLSKMLRKGEIRVDGRRARPNDRLIPGSVVRVPPLGDLAEAPPPPPDAPGPESGAGQALRDAVLYRDAWVIALDKPPGLAVQGGSNTRHHLDAMLDALRFDADERPRLVHRLDRDTSGVLLLGRTAAATDALARAFKSREAEKIYWALVVGVPRPKAGHVDAPLAKKGGKGGERVRYDPNDGRPARTDYATLEVTGKRAAWVALAPRTGRTHQLRAHCAVVLETPVLGDGKYGGRDAFLEGADVADRVHLHARAIDLPHPAGGRLQVTAPLPEHMERAFRFFGFNESEAPADPFADMA